jgi:hypothetical protein
LSESHTATTFLSDEVFLTSNMESDRKMQAEMKQTTQSVFAVVELLKFLERSVDPLPEVVALSDSEHLTKSSKNDCYYYTSPNGCSCPGFFYRHNCKHMNTLTGSPSEHRGQTIGEVLEEHDRNLHKMPKSYQRMVRMARQEAEADSDPDSLIKHGGFKPVYPDDEPSEADLKTKQDQEA